MRLLWKVKPIPVGGLALSALASLVAGCGEEEENGRPTAASADYATLEETAVSGSLKATDPDGDALTYYVRNPLHGFLSLDRITGNFSFQPDLDFYGTASFQFYVSDGKASTPLSTVSISVENVNDPPRIEAVPTLRNSAETEFVEYQVIVVDPDPDQHTFSVAVEDPRVVNATIDRDTGSLSLKALQIGDSHLEVVTSDGEYDDSTTFDFIAEEVTKNLAVSMAEPDVGAIVLTNVTDQPVDFVLTHNGFTAFEDLDQVVAYIRDMPEQFAGEGFERKLWRFVRDSVYHELSLTSRRWLYDPWVTLNSLGWGLCGHVAGTFVEIARAAGYEARVWGLEGHVVPEIRVNGEWQMFDPDISVYYRAEDGTIAGVEELAANPNLITAPVDPVLDTSTWQLSYSQLIADIYSSTADNFDGGSLFIAPQDTPSSRVVLPAGARLTYPGRWTDPPTLVLAPDSYPAPHFRQALLELREGWTGQITLPWMAWEVLGSGQVGIDGTAYTVGSQALTNRLQGAVAPVTSLDVYSSASISVVFLVNAVRYGVASENQVEVLGFNMWAIQGHATTLPIAQAAGASLPPDLAKPLPIVDR